MGFYQKLFANKYDSFMDGIEKEFFTLRKDLLEPLEGKILDVGSGTGVNFDHFNENTEITAIEPSVYMLEKAKNKFPNRKNITFHNLGIGNPKLNNIIADNSLDYIVSTLVLCTVANPKAALADFTRWLKPTGQLIILEHIHSHKKVNRVLQNIINPVWKIVGDGCNLNRDTDLLIKQAGFELIEEEYFKRTLQFYKGVFNNK